MNRPIFKILYRVYPFRNKDNQNTKQFKWFFLFFLSGHCKFEFLSLKANFGVCFKHFFDQRTLLPARSMRRSWWDASPNGRAATLGEFGTRPTRAKWTHEERETHICVQNLDRTDWCVTISALGPKYFHGFLFPLFFDAPNQFCGNKKTLN